MEYQNKELENALELLKNDSSSKNLDLIIEDMQHFMSVWQKNPAENQFYYTDLYKQFNELTSLIFSKTPFIINDKISSIFRFIPISSVFKIVQLNNKNLDDETLLRLVQILSDAEDYDSLIDIAYINPSIFKLVENEVFNQTNLEFLYKFMEKYSQKINIHSFVLRADKIYTRYLSNAKNSKKQRTGMMYIKKIKNLQEKFEEVNESILPTYMEKFN